MGFFAPLIKVRKTFMLTFSVFSEEEMLSLGARFILLCQPPCVIYLKGNLGAGKTTLVRGFLNGLGYQGVVKSPSYTLLEQYEIGDKKIYHFDLYRLDSSEELNFIGVRDCLNDDAIIFVEWPEKGNLFLPSANLECKIEFLEKGGRIVELRGNKCSNEINKSSL